MNSTEILNFQQSIYTTSEKNEVYNFQSEAQRSSSETLADSSSLIPTLILTFIYLNIVKIGPGKIDKKLNLKYLISFYNFLQIMFSSWMFYGIALEFSNYNFLCEPIDTTENGTKMKNMIWWYFISKFTEFFDTFFFITQRKFANLSTLHIFHHGIMPIFTWYGYTHAPTGHETLGALLNTFVHIVMYTYYFLTIIGVNKKYLFFKKYITSLQLLQFAILICHSSILFFYNPCGFPIIHSILMVSLMSIFFVLFVDFYFQSYKKKN